MTINSANQFNQNSDSRNDGLIVLATFDSAPEAHRLRLDLETDGIRVSVLDLQSPHIAGISNSGRVGAVRVEVLVLKSDAERAVEIKNHFLAHADQIEIPEWKCECGESVDAGFAQCWSCMKPYNSND